MCRVDVVCPPFHVLMYSWLSKAFIHEVHSFCNHDSLHVSCVSILQKVPILQTHLRLAQAAQKERVRHLLGDARYSLPLGSDVTWIEFGIA